jgi:serine phosphatase RsbU (regulator of sigma subunit)/DNA-binding NarL/FixJ family response regulator
MSDRDPIRVVIADDQAIVRSGLGAFVMAYDQLDLVGEAKDGVEAVELCEMLSPDVVLMDLKMPRMDGIAATRLIRQRWQNIHVLMLTSFREKDKIQAALDAGATGYLLKDLSAEELVEAIMQVYQGRRLISQAASEAIFQAEQMDRLEEESRLIHHSLDELSQLLNERLPGIFPDCQIQVRLFPDRDLYQHLQPLPKAAAEAAWRWLETAVGPVVFSIGDTYPWGGLHPPEGDLVLAPISGAAAGWALGGVALQYSGELQEHDELLNLVERLVSLISQQVKPALPPVQDGSQGRASQELEMAWRIQAGIMPEGAPSVSGWDISAQLEPARETSGDFYDFIPLASNKWAFVIADVTDKGLGAAVFMAMCSTLIRNYAARYPTLPAIAMSSVNERILSDTRGSLFVTAFYGILETDIGRLRYVNAGHNPPFFLSSLKSKPLDRLTRTGIPLGISQDSTWQQKVVKFSPGDALVLYTDGITEARNQQGDYFGEQRLLNVLRTSIGQPAQKIQQALLDEVMRFSGSAPRDDDIALIVLSRRE